MDTLLSPPVTPHPKLGHRQGQGGDATRAPSRCCWGTWMSSRLLIKAVYCCTSPFPTPLTPLPRVPPQAWHSQPSLSTALQTPLLNPSSCVTARHFHIVLLILWSLQTPIPAANLAGTAEPSLLPLIRSLPLPSNSPPLPGEFVLGAEVLFLEHIFLMGISDVTQARGSNSPVPWYLHIFQHRQGKVSRREPGKQEGKELCALYCQGPITA